MARWVALFIAGHWSMWFAGKNMRVVLNRVIVVIASWILLDPKGNLQVAGFKRKRSQRKLWMDFCQRSRCWTLVLGVQKSSRLAKECHYELGHGPVPQACPITPTVLSRNISKRLHLNTAIRFSAPAMFSSDLCPSTHPSVLECREARLEKQLQCSALGLWRSQPAN